MKRLVIIGWASVLLASAAFPQLGRLSGEIRYEHQYQDVLVNGTLLTSLRRSPSISLNTDGFFTSPNFIYYTLRTSLNTSFRTSHSASSLVTTRSYLWNAYDVNVFFFQIAPANFQLSTREYTTDIRYEYQGLKNRGGTRNHEDRVGLALVRVPYLPLVNFSYRRNRSWSIVGDPYENLSNQYVFSASSRNGTTGHASVTGSLSDFRETHSDYYERILSVQFDGSHSLSEEHQVTIGSEYYKYGSYSALSGGLAYGGRLAEGVRMNSGVNGQSASSVNYSARTVSTTHSVQFTPGQNFRLGAGVNAGTGVALNRVGGVTRRIENHNWSGSLSLGHTRNAGGLGLSNNISLAYGERRYFEKLGFYRIGVNNGVHKSVGRFVFNAAYNFSYQSNRNAARWSSTDHFALIAATGTLPGAIRTRTSADFRSYTYDGNRITASDQSSLNLLQSFDGSFKHLIPFTLGAGASVHYFFIGLRGHTYGWNASFQSSEFFVRGLYAAYRYTRSFDPYYRRESLEHSASFSYRWRLLSFQLTLREREVFNRLRDVRFSVERTL